MTHNDLEPDRPHLLRLEQPGYQPQEHTLLFSPGEHRHLRVRLVPMPARLDLLSQEAYYTTLRYGYARGFEAKQYVKNIRSYYDTLVWMDTREHPLLVAQR